MNRGLDILKLLHKLGVDMQTARRIYDNVVEALVLCIRNRLFGNLDGIALPHFEYGHVNLLADNLQLLDGGRTVNVARYKQRSVVFLFEL